MQLIQDVIGEDVIGLTGQNLTKDELLVLVGLANGDSPNKIGASLNADALAMRHIEASIKAKLGAKTQPNMIARGFTLGVLVPRALCLLLSVLCATEHTSDTNRNPTRRPRNTSESRLTRSSNTKMAGGSNGESECAIDAGYFYFSRCIA